MVVQDEKSMLHYVKTYSELILYQTLLITKIIKSVKLIKGVCVSYSIQISIKLVW